jgi:hypothetical protein
VKVPMASFITPTMKGPTSPPAFRIDADGGDGERKHHGSERQAQGRGRKGGRGDEQRQRHVPGPLARQVGHPHSTMSPLAKR